jgi:ATP-dependent DNA helicase RecQ
MCSNCTENVKSVDVTEDARAVLRCVHALRGRYGKTVVADICTGANNSRTRELKLRCEKSFGALKCSKDEALDLIEMLVARQLLSVAAGEYPTLGLGPFWREAGEAGFKVSIKGKGRSQKSSGSGRGAKSYPGAYLSAGSSSGTAGSIGGGRVGGGGSRVGGGSYNANKAQNARVQGESDELFEELRDLRKTIADSEGKPPYVVCSDATLRDMCARRPTNDQELLEVHGIGPHKAARYGEAFLQAIKDFKY